MTQYEAPQEILDGLANVQRQFIDARQMLARLAASVSCADYPNVVASISLITDSADGAVMMTETHLRRYRPAEADVPASGDSSEVNASAVAMQTYLEQIGRTDPSRAASRSASVGRTAARIAR